MAGHGAFGARFAERWFARARRQETALPRQSECARCTGFRRNSGNGAGAVDRRSHRAAAVRPTLTALLETGTFLEGRYLVWRETRHADVAQIRAERFVD